MKKLTLATLVALASSVSLAQMMAGPMSTSSYYPLVDGARYDYVFVNGPHTTGTTVMHAGQTWSGVSGLMGVHLSLVCKDAVPCTIGADDFYRMDPDGMRWFGGAGQTPDGNHYMMNLTDPALLLKNPVSPGTMMGPGMGYQNSEAWQTSIAGMNTMMGPIGYANMYQAMALETVVTPAGTFTNCLHVREKRGDGTERDVWYAPNVGVVRWADKTEEALLTKMTVPTGAVPKVALAVEYYHAAFDHYFMTANPAEMTALDTGHFQGWQRTGQAFNVIDPAETNAPNTAPVCRYYGNPEAGLNTHFYSASAEECAAVHANWPQSWTLESPNVFRVSMPHPMTGICPAGTVPMYRSWNRRPDTNHRYTTDPVVQASMTSHGHHAEGIGNPPVAMCSPQ